jgi:AraC-like DNA-binding protein/mannose-6-phosphate isomerase-like protein (cupin superfamily)
MGGIFAPPAPIKVAVMSLPEHLDGPQIGLPLLQRLGIVHSDSASRVAWHAHRGFEILFLTAGTTGYEFRAGHAVELHGGEFLVIPPGTKHRGQHDMRSPCRICGLALSPLDLPAWQNTAFKAEDLTRLRSSLDHSAMSIHPFSPALRWIIKRLTEEVQDYLTTGASFTSQASLRILVCAALVEVVRQILSPPQAPKEIVAAAVRYLNTHCQRTVSIGELARHLGYSRSRTFELFKAEMGLTPNDYLQRVRMQKAQAMLRNTRRPITDIALSTGFNSSQYFSTVFRRYTGQSPAEFRQTTAQSQMAGLEIEH